MTQFFEAAHHPIAPFTFTAGDIVSANGITIDEKTAADLIASWQDAADDCRERGRYATGRLFSADASSLSAALTVAKAHTDAARAIVAADGRGWAMGRTIQQGEAR